MPAISHESLLKQLNWRYAVKSFDPGKKIPAETWRTLEDAMILAPSSYGLQPWRFNVVIDPAVRSKLRAASYNQSQITDASHLVVFSRRSEMTAADVDRLVDRICEVRKTPREALTGLRDMMASSMSTPATLPGGSVDIYTARQTYIALGFLLSAAALLDIDACPMEGFDPVQYDEILDLRSTGYTATVVASVGYRSASDWLAPMPKVRFNRDEVIKYY
ncbi:MAG: NAD(P)H-dependent oxidoreductase [Pyrinomonadaceae bacterium]|nr:NAD(P)H-dependent oxidoreductase [Phycisphaerales bacterium]